MLFGAQVKQAGGLLAALRRAEAMGAQVMQVFAQSPRQWRYPEGNAERVVAFSEAWPASPVVRRVVCHAPYLINLGSGDAEMYERSNACLAENLRAAAAMGASGLVLHLGSHLGAGLDARLDTIVSGLRRALDASDCPVLLENTAGAGGTIGRSFEELARVIAHAGGDPRLGLCLDTQHAWAAGMSFDTVAEADALLDEIGRTVGIERLACLHVNDSKVPRAAGLDRHDNVGRGRIGRPAFRALLGHPRLQGLPAVLEVPGTDNQGPDARELRAVRRLHTEGLKLRAREGLT
ncbi:MAG TPA: deoxyribonuclease IV [Acidimicrobiales bacterium]|nr:deoxyribonuclease IV [Acidimicrobiales bacterium]